MRICESEVGDDVVLESPWKDGALRVTDGGGKIVAVKRVSGIVWAFTTDAGEKHVIEEA